MKAKAKIFPAALLGKIPSLIGLGAIAPAGAACPACRQAGGEANVSAFATELAQAAASSRAFSAPLQM